MSTTDAEEAGRAEGTSREPQATGDARPDRRADSPEPRTRQLDRVARNARAIEQRNVDRAIRRLEGDRDLTDRERRAVEALAADLIAGVLDNPAMVLAAAAAAGDEATLQTGAGLLLGE